MNVLMIGGTGILSTDICKHAIEKGFHVVTLNRGKRKEFLNPQATNIIADIRKDESSVLKKKINFIKYDVVIDFISYNKAQLQKTLELITDNCKQFIFISSATVYEEKEAFHRYRESDSIHNRKWDYCIHKAECEEYLSQREWPFFITIVRPYITYGKTRIPFQIVPLKYYTLINRIKNNKYILMSNKDAVCTLTNTKEFAIAVTGLFGNEKAYGQSVHITSDCEYTWSKVADILGDCLHKEVSLLDIPIKYLENLTNPGFEIEELKGDKSRNMIFDNTKIKGLVPEFKGNTAFEQKAGECIEFYCKKQHQIVDYIWEGRIDRIICRYSKYKHLNLEKKKYSLSGNKEHIGIKNRFMYYVGRYEILYSSAKKIKKFSERKSLNQENKAGTEEGSLFQNFKEVPVLFSDNSKCCGCSACMAVCPLNAITFQPDEEGYKYPVITKELCINCKKCIKVCPLNKKIDEY